MNRDMTFQEMMRWLSRLDDFRAFLSMRDRDILRHHGEEMALLASEMKTPDRDSRRRFAETALGQRTAESDYEWAWERFLHAIDLRALEAVRKREEGLKAKTQALEAQLAIEKQSRHRAENDARELQNRYMNLQREVAEAYRRRTELDDRLRQVELQVHQEQDRYAESIRVKAEADTRVGDLKVVIERERARSDACQRALQQANAACEDQRKKYVDAKLMLQAAAMARVQFGRTRCDACKGKGKVVYLPGAGEPGDAGLVADCNSCGGTGATYTVAYLPPPST